MLTFDDFMEAIRAEPGDDFPRLMFADFLDEQVGIDSTKQTKDRWSTWAGMIRGDVSPSLTLTEAVFPWVMPIVNQAGRLQVEVDGEIVGGAIVAEPFAPYVRIPNGLFRFRRGFLDELVIPIPVLEDHAHTLFQHPIRSCRLPYPPLEHQIEHGWRVWGYLNHEGVFARNFWNVMVNSEPRPTATWELRGATVAVFWPTQEVASTATEHAMLTYGRKAFIAARHLKARK